MPLPRLLAPILTAPTLAALVLAAVAAPVPTPSAAPATAPLRIDDFEDGDLDAASGLSWIVIADDQLGGGSSAEVEVVADAANAADAAASTSGSRRCLRLSGRTAEGFAAPFAGAWAAVGEGGRLRDLSRFGGLRFRARALVGAGGEFQAGVRRGGGSRSANYLRTFVASARWARIEVPFTELSQSGPPGSPIPWSAEDVGWVGFTTQPGHAGEFALEIDDVEFFPAAAAEQPPPRASKLRLTPASAVEGFAWRPLAAEEGEDGKRPRLPDARALAVHHDRTTGLVWFRIDLVRPLDRRGFGVNLAIDADGDPADGTAWWGPTNTEFHFDRLVTVWVLAAGPDFQGAVGVADAAAVAEGTFNNLLAEGLQVAIDDGDKTLFLGVPRTALGNTGRGTELRIAATVGSSFVANDDLPDHGAVALPAD